MKYSNFQSYIPPACALWPGSYLGCWTEVFLTLWVTFGHTGRPVQSNISDFLLFWIFMYIIYSNFGAHIRPPRCTLTGGCLEEWPKVCTTLQMTFRGTQKLIKIDIPQFLPLCTSHIYISVHTSGWWASHQLVAVQNSGPGYMQHSGQPLGVLGGQYKLILVSFYLYVHHMFTFRSTHQASELHINRWLLGILVWEIYNTAVKLLGHLSFYLYHLCTSNI